MHHICRQFKTLIFLLVSSSIWAQPIEYDKELGKQYSVAVESQMGVYENAILTGFVNSIGEKLVKELGKQPFDYSFKIADTEITNAFALPGGYTYVTRGSKFYQYASALLLWATLSDQANCLHVQSSPGPIVRVPYKRFCGLLRHCSPSCQLDVYSAVRNTNASERHQYPKEPQSARRLHNV